MARLRLVAPAAGGHEIAIIQQMLYGTHVARPAQQRHTRLFQTHGHVTVICHRIIRYQYQRLVRRCAAFITAVQ